MRYTECRSCLLDHKIGNIPSYVSRQCSARETIVRLGVNLVKIANHL